MTTKRVLSRAGKATLISGGALATTAAVIATSFAVLSINNAGAFEQAITAECAPLVVLAFRGSGEENLTAGVNSNAGAPFQYGDSGLVTNGWEGPTLRGLFTRLADTVVDDFRADQIPVIPIGPASNDEPYGYDAIDAVLEASSVESALSYSSSRLLHSASRGAEAATHLIREYLEGSVGCPITPSFVAVGFSQGAMAARHTAELNPESVLGVIKIGDPYQMPDAPGVRAAGASGIGIIRWKADDVQRKLLDTYYTAGGLRTSICHPGDPICEFSPLEGLIKLATGNYGAHLDYYTDVYPDEAETDALAIAQVAHEQWRRARAAWEAGNSVGLCERGDGERSIRLQSPSLSFAGTPTLVSAFSPDHVGCELVYEFDLDGDGVFETTSRDGTVWVTFDEDGSQPVTVKISEPGSGQTHEASTDVPVAPEDEGEIVFDGDGTLIPPAPPTPEEPPAAQPPAPNPPATHTPQPPRPPQPTPPPAPTPPLQPQPEPEPEPEPDPQPAFDISGSPVAPEGQFTVTGWGLGPHTTARVGVETLQIFASVIADAQGGFTIDIEIPAWAFDGVHDGVIEVDAAPGVIDEYPFDIEVLAADPGDPGDDEDGGDPGEDPPGEASTWELHATDTHLWAGESFTLFGSGFMSFARLTVLSETDPQIMQSLQADVDGNLSALVAVPQGVAPGIHTVWVEVEVEPNVYDTYFFDIEVLDPAG